MTDQIAKEFGINVSTIARDRINPKIGSNYVEKSYLVTVKSLESRSKLINYLEVFPLLSSKYLDYSDWKKAQIIVNMKQHKSIEGSSEIIRLKNSMNTKREFFDWSHLDKFLNNL